MSPKLRILVICTLVTVPLDQLTKYWVSAQIPRGERVPVIDGFFDITHVRNTGAAFGLLDQAPEEWRTLLFASVGILALAVIVFFFRELAPGDRLSALGLALILGGAVGNFCDRILRAEVVDFLHFRLIGEYAWPDFNLADVFIVSGVLALGIELLAAEGKSRAEAASPATRDAELPPRGPAER
jgi:signal peptidase II